MYESFYGLKEKPFSILPDPSFLYMGRRHSLAYSVLEYGVDSQGLTVITGEIGSGKTTLVRHLLRRLRGDVNIGLVSNLHTSIGDILPSVMVAFGLPVEDKPRAVMFDDFCRFLVAAHAQGKRNILIVDEAQNLDRDALEHLRLISNVNADKRQVLQTVLVGQPQLKALLRRPELRQVGQRVAADFHIEPLQSDEVNKYIRHRLRVAGRQRPLFSSLACDRVATVSHGVPRTINVLCDTILVYGYARRARQITEEIVEAVIRDKSEYGVISFEEAAAEPGAVSPVDMSKPISHRGTAAREKVIALPADNRREPGSAASEKKSAAKADEPPPVDRQGMRERPDSMSAAPRAGGCDDAEICDYFSDRVRQAVRRGQSIVVSLEWTEFDGEEIATLSLNLLTDERQVTRLIWCTVPKSTIANGSRNRVELTLLKRLKETLPEGVTVTVTGERGPLGAALLGMLRARWGFDYVIRLRGDLAITAASGEERPVAQWTGKTGEVKRLRQARLTSKGFAFPAILVVKTRWEEEPWCLAASDPESSPAELVRTYIRNRMAYQSPEETVPPAAVAGQKEA